MLYNLNLLNEIFIIASCESPQEPYDISRFIEELRSGFTELKGRLQTIDGRLSGVDCIFPEYQPNWSIKFQQCTHELEQWQGELWKQWEQWALQRQDIDMGTEIGRGNFGIVLKGT